MKRDYLLATPKQLPLHVVFMEQLKAAGVTYPEFSSRRMAMAKVRHKVWHYLVRNAGASYKEIARLSGGFDLSAVAYGVQKHQDRLNLKARA